MTGMTLKQMSISGFFEGIQKYKDCLKNKDSLGIIRASLQIMANKGNVPKKYWRFSSYKYLTSESV